MAHAKLASPAEVAEYLGIPESTLRQWRWQKTGPRFAHIGRYVRYDWSDVYAFAEAAKAPR